MRFPFKRRARFTGRIVVAALALGMAVVSMALVGMPHPYSLYIRLNDMPKLNALKQRYPQRYTTRYADGSHASAASVSNP